MAKTRREFLRDIGLGVGAAGAATLIPSLSASAPPASDRRGRVLLMLQLSGGNDGLNTVIPYEDDRYHRARPGLRIRKPKALGLKGGAGLHPAMRSLKGLYDEGKVAVIQGVGYPKPSRSHFRSMEIWHTANPTASVDRDGWLGRMLVSQLRGGVAPGVVIGSEQPLAVAMPRGQVTVVPRLRDFRPLPDPRAGGDRRVRVEALRDVQNASRHVGDNDTLAFIAQAAKATLLASDRIQRIAGSYRSPVRYRGQLGRKLQIVASLLAGGADYSMYYLTQGGYDTHANQARSHARRLGELSDALAAFQKDLHRLGLERRVVVVAFSEFGRRVAENGSRGTDHGTAGPMILVSGAAKGGVYGHAPDLGNLDRGDLKYSTDFRRVYRTVLDWLGVDPRKVLRGRFPPLPLLG